ncbi:MAG: hypothetical protein RIS76_4307, partial [Verrucomicrobiota bacterium]
SGDESLRTFAADPDPESPMRLEVHWRSGARSVVQGVLTNRIYEISETRSIGAPESTSPPAPVPLFRDASSLIGHTHSEESFDDWTRQPMLPRRLSRLGPGVSWFDLDGDGWEDLTVTSGRGGRLAAYHNDQGHRFTRTGASPTAPGDQGAVLGWANGQGGRSLLVAQSNFERTAGEASTLEVYGGTDLANPVRLPAGDASLGPMALADVDGDGDLDLFLGGRCRPGRYPEAVASMIWINERGTLQPSPKLSEPFQSLGMVSGATFADLDADGAPDLALALEWGPIRIFHNAKGQFSEATTALGLAGLTGWWTGITAGDFDGDGRLDLACGNWGHNSNYEMFQPTVFRLYYGDWNGDGGLQMIESWKSGSDWLPVHDRTWLERGFPRLADQFTTHEAFGRATLGDLLGSGHATNAFLEATELSSLVLLNRGNRFEAIPLPREAQMAPVFSVNVGDLDGDGAEDLFLSQNFFGTASDLSRDDGGWGLCLQGTGRGTFTAMDARISGIRVPGEQRGAALVDFNQDARVDLAVSQNSAATHLYANQGAKPGLRVVLKGPAGNPDGIGAQMRLLYPGDRRGPCRAVQSGSGYWSQDAAVQILGLQGSPTALWIRWPGGREQTISVEPSASSVRVEFKE